MKGLSAIPQLGELQAAYHALELAQKPGNSFPSPKDLALFLQWVRFDARLGEIYIQFLLKNWKDLNPMALNQEIKRHPWPQVMGVLLEQILELGVWPAERLAFKNWSTCVMSEILPADYELFFIGTLGFAKTLMRQESQRPNRHYLRWRYLGREVLFSKAQNIQNQKTLLSPKIRREILRTILTKNRSITVTQYIDALEGQVSRRQAERDLNLVPGLRGRGKTRAKRWSF